MLDKGYGILEKRSDVSGLVRHARPQVSFFFCINYLFTTGAAVVSSATGATCLGVTLPLMNNTCVKSSVPLLRVTVTDLWNAPGRPEAL